MKTRNFMLPNQQTDMLDRTKSPEIKPFENISIPQARKQTLDNGIPLTIIDNGSEEVNRISLIWDGGSVDAQKSSVASITAGLLREGSTQYNGNQIAEILDFNGAWLKSSVQSHHTSIILHSLNSKSKNVIPILSEIAYNPTFPEKEFNVTKERKAQSTELAMKKVTHLCEIADRELIFGKNHPISKFETPKEIREITIQELKELHNRIYTPNTLGIYLAGRITPQLEDLINNTFGQINLTEKPSNISVIPAESSSEREKKVNLDEALQSAISISIPTINRNHPDYIPLRLTIMALGGYFGSRLMLNIREDKGYTYGIYAALLGFKEGGVINISTQCDNSYTYKVIDEIKKEIELLKYNNMDNDELNRLKRYAMSQLVTTLDSPFSIMDYYENIRCAGTPEDYFSQQINAINSLSSESIAYYASKYLSADSIYTAIAGDISKM